MKATYSISIASFQCVHDKACSIVCGSPVDVKQPKQTCPSINTFGFLMPACNLVLGRVYATTKSSTDATGVYDPVAALDPGVDDCRTGVIGISPSTDPPVSCTTDGVMAPPD